MSLFGQTATATAPSAFGTGSSLFGNPSAPSALQQQQQQQQQQQPQQQTQPAALPPLSQSQAQLQSSLWQPARDAPRTSIVVS
jgi:nuclear pore complex protein Nup54